MTLKQERFLTAYLETGSASQAAIMAGYSGKFASRIGYALLQKKGIKERIETIMAKERQSALMSRNERRAFWEQIMTDETAKTADRLKASELLAKSYGDFDAGVIERERLDSLTPEARQTEKNNSNKIFFPEAKETA